MTVGAWTAHLTRRRPSTAAYAYALVLAIGIGYMVARIPVQVSDCLGNLLQIQHAAWQHLIVNQFWNSGFLRPLLWAQIKGMYDLAHGHYWLTFKVIHAAQLVAMALLFVRLLRVRTMADLLPVPIAVAVLIGLHTFNGTVREGYPVNSFLTIVVCTLAVANLSIAAHRWWHDVAAVLLFVFAALTVESGLLVLVAVVAGRLVGLRGISWTGVAACVLLAGGYFYLRFGPLAVGTPSLLERPSGYGFRILEPEELQARFGASPLLFYLYNVVCNLATVLFAEPRAGVWTLVHALSSGGELPPWLVINVVASLAATLVVGWWLVRRVPAWWRWRLDDDDRVAFVAVGVLVANAVLGYAYTKDAIMSTGGAFFAVLVCLALRALVGALPAFSVAARNVAVVFVAVLSVTWAVRAVALPHLLREQAFRVRSDWATVYVWLDAQHIALQDEDARRLVEQLRRQALASPAPHPNIGRSPLRRFLDLN